MHLLDFAMHDASRASRRPGHKNGRSAPFWTPPGWWLHISQLRAMQLTCMMSRRWLSMKESEVDIAMFHDVDQNRHACTTGNVSWHDQSLKIIKIRPIVDDRSLAVRVELMVNRFAWIHALMGGDRGGAGHVPSLGPAQLLLGLSRILLIFQNK